MVEYHLISAKDIVATASARQESLTRNITRAESGKGTSWSQRLEQMDGLNAKEVLTSMKGDNFIFPIEDWNSQIVWRRSGSENIHYHPG